MAKGVFITGTDTGVGKTWLTIALMEALKKEGRYVLGMKPIASGANYENGKLINDDARLIMEHGSEPIDYDLINPSVFELPTAPSFAASHAKQTVDLKKITNCYNSLAEKSENIIVEGVGGWRAPLFDNGTTVDLVREMDLPVIMVVGMRLGCINHAILSAEAIRADGISLCGWASNLIEKDYQDKESTINLLNERLGCMNIAHIDHMCGFNPVDMALNFNRSFILGSVFR